MPIYTYESEEGDSIEHICSYKTRPSTIVEDGIVYYYRISPVARLASWETEPYGVSGVYDGNIGKRVYTRAERNRAYDAAGLEPLTPSNAHRIDERLEKKERHTKQMKRNSEAMDIVSKETTLEGWEHTYDKLMGDYEQTKLTEIIESKK